MVDRLFDLAICGLLVATIAHLALVQRRLRAFRAERDRLQAFVTALDLTVERAESAIRRMRPLTAGDGDTAAAAAKPRALRERAPEELLKAARAAAGVPGGAGERRAGGAAGSRRPSRSDGRSDGRSDARSDGRSDGRHDDQRAATLADALQDAIGG